jgi:rsbT antagonist protein RsbS
MTTSGSDPGGRASDVDVFPAMQSRIPVIRLWGVLLVPLQGDITDAQVSQLVTAVLNEIRRGTGSGVVVDLSGLEIVDSHLCAAFTNLASAARYMGATTVLCGLSAEIAMTLQSMGIELQGVSTTLTLEQALATLGLRPHRRRALSAERAAARELADEMLARDPAMSADAENSREGQR